MRKAVIATFVSAALACSLAAPAALAEPRWASCGDVDYGSGIDNVKAEGVSCSVAKHVAKHQVKTGDNHFNGWNCEKRGQGDRFCIRAAAGHEQHVKYHYDA